MTHIAGGSRRGVPKVWILPVLALVMILIAISLGILSRSVLVDLIAWWPVWLVLVVFAFLARGRRWGRVRVSALVAILWVLFIAAFLTGHILGWVAMPSAATVLNGPQAGSVSTGALSARINGQLEVGSGQSGFLYAVEPVRRGGEIGPPVGNEQLQGPNIAVALEPSSAALGAAPENVVVTVSGAFEISLPPGVPARVVGEATVPAGWAQTDDGYESPTPGAGWVISVGEGSSLTVTDH
ncbi:MAG: hypothetical protein K0T01_1064 [Acidimicrobiia bacterium]|nr:hypothetical protein [Acidimicrobiia bacterium]